MSRKISRPGRPRRRGRGHLVWLAATLAPILHGTTMAQEPSYVLGLSPLPDAGLDLTPAALRCEPFANGT